MPRQLRTTPRKRPRQDRSVATVDTILEATARILVKHGFDRTTTNAVAEAAGVSIGSVYQYFPNKEALVAALIERQVTLINAEAMTELARVAQLPVAEAVRAMIELVIRGFTIAPALRRILIEQVPRIGRLGRIAELQQGTYRMVTALLTARRAEISIDNPEVAAFLLVSAIMAVAHRATVLQPDRLHDPVLIDEACKMVTRYLGVASG